MVNESQVSMSSSSSSANAFSFISKGWKEVKVSADADLQLMRDRANSFKNLANSFDRELENFLNSTSAFSVSTNRSSHPPEIDFVKKLKPKLNEFRRAYSSPDFSKKVLEKWGPRPSLRIDLSAIKNAIVSEVEDGSDGIGDFDRVWMRRRVTFREFWGVSKGEEEADEGQSRDWEPIRALKTRLKEFEKRSSTSEIFGGFKNSEFLEKVKSSLVCFLLFLVFYVWCFECKILPSFDIMLKLLDIYMCFF